jgi:hypothetical protein
MSNPEDACGRGDRGGEEVDWARVIDAGGSSVELVVVMGTAVR